MKVAERRAKIRAMIEQELTDVESEDLVGYLNTVISAIATLKLIASAENWQEMPQTKIIDIIDAASSNLIFQRDLLKEVLYLLARLYPYQAAKASVWMKRSKRARGISTMSVLAGDR